MTWGHEGGRPDRSTLADEELVTLIRGGQHHLFEPLMRRYNQRIYRAVRGFLNDETEVEDVMQQAYLRAFLHLDQLSEGGKVAAWLVRIAVNEALTRRRRRTRLAEQEFIEDEEGTQMDVPPNRASSPETEASDRELATLLEAAIGDLREIYRVVFVLREVEGMSTAEVADALSVSEEVVKVRLHRAKELLRVHILERAGRAAADVFQFHAPRCDRVVAGVLAHIRTSIATRRDP